MCAKHTACIHCPLMRESTIIFLPLEEDDIRTVIRRPDTAPMSEMMTMKMLMYDEERRHMIVQQLVILNDMNRLERIYANMNFYCDSNMFIYEPNDAVCWPISPRDCHFS